MTSSVLGRRNAARDAGHPARLNTPDAQTLPDAGASRKRLITRNEFDRTGRPNTNSQRPFQAILHGSLQAPVARLAVGLRHIDQQDSPAHRVADDLDLAWVLAAAVPAAVVLLLGELAHRDGEENEKRQDNGGRNR